MGNKGGLVSTFVVEKEGFATTCTAINAHLCVAGVPWSRVRTGPERYLHRPAHEGKFHERMDALEEILKKAKVLRSDIAVLAGDLNWRLDTDHVWDGSVEHCIREGDWIRLASRSGETSLRATITDRVAPGVVYTTFHHPGTQANVITTDYTDWATNCPEYKVTAVQVTPSNGPSDWQEDYAELSVRSRRISQPEPAE